MDPDPDIATEHVESLKAPARQRKRSVRLTNPSDLVPIDITEDSVENGHAAIDNETHNEVPDTIDEDNEKDVIDNDSVKIHVELAEETEEEPMNTRGSSNTNAHSENDIIYDDTKPKRLPNPKTLKLGLDQDSDNVNRATKPSPRSSLHESIGLLISPDEADCPTKRRRRLPMHNQSSMESSVGDNTQTTPVDTHVVVPDIVKGEHYQPSPKMARRKQSNKADTLTIDTDHAPRCSSPVERLINKNGPHAVTSQVVRKHSSDARLGGNRERIKPPPQRKMSLEAGLEAHRYHEESDAIQQLRRRKVSFDTSALLNGTRLMPLNDEIAVSDSQELYIDGENDDVNIAGEHEHTHSNTNGDLSNGNDAGDGETLTQNGVHNKRLYRGDEYYDNEAYQNDEEDFFGDDAQGQQGEYDDVNLHNSPATIEHTNIPSPDRYNMNGALSYTNGRVKKMSTTSVDSQPKSILKVRKEDTESMISEDSVVSGKAFKVRRDSIALFTGSDGSMQMQVLRKQHSNTWKKFGKKDIQQMWTNRHENVQKYKLHIFVLVLFTLTLGFVIAGLHFHKQHHDLMEIAKRIFFDARKRELSLLDVKERDEFSAILGQDIPLWQQPTHCFTNYKEIHDKTCLLWRNNARLNIAYSTVRNTSCYTIKWDLEPGVIPFDCFKLSDSYWYGPSNFSTSEWPVKPSKFEFSDSRSNFYGSGTFSHAFEYYWLSSRGSLIYVESQGPLEINWNDMWHGYVCFTGHEPESKVNIENNVTYTMCNGIDIRDTHETFSDMYFPKVKSLPEKYLLESPHWSTVWDSSQFTVNESILTNLANNLVKHGFECSAIEIDGKWEDHYGDLTFNIEEFPNITNVFNTISNASCQASLNIYPYVSFQSDSFKSGNLTYDYFVKDTSKTVPALVKWQHELGAMLDVSNPKAREWFAGKLKNISHLYDIKTFRLSYGISDWFPFSPSFNTSDVTPSKLKFMFSELLTTVGETIVQSTSNSQNITTLIGVSSDIVTNPQTGVSCISNLIPDVLNLGIAGYPFVMADGFAIEKKMAERSFDLPSRSLFIRWMQFSSFFPAMRYTIKPWVYDKEVIELSNNLTQFHKDVIVKTFYEFETNLLGGEPFIQPLWWVDPHDSQTFRINDQFIVAGRYLVAPIFCEETNGNHSYRDIYVPKGLWMDKSRDGVARGPTWIRRYKVGTNTIPYFEKMVEIGNGRGWI